MKARCRLRRVYKKGASLAMVLVSITILAIMGTLFTAIAMRSYEYSYAKLCKQQAYYTARSSIEAFYSMVTSNTALLTSLLTELQAEYLRQVAAAPSGVVDPTTVGINVGSTGGGDGSGLVAGGFFDTFLGDCELRVRYADQKMSQLSIEAHATYNGYSESARALIARTNFAASELKKIFDNTFCLQSPISTIVTDGINGDVYVSQPAPYMYNDDGSIKTTGNEGVYNHILEQLKKNGSYQHGSKTYYAVAGQYLREDDGSVTTYTSTDVGKYNYILSTKVYGNVQASTEDSSLVGHTKPIGMDNMPLANGLYNDWVELYMFSAVKGDVTMDGNLYAHSRVLVGLIDKDQSGRQYISYWDDAQQRRIFPQRASATLLTSNVYPTYGLEGNSAGQITNYEHGFAKDVFFDHTQSAVLDVGVSKFRINGNMYLWEDARIENMDSTQTENALNGVKNNIYAAKDLYIDGYYIEDWSSIFSWATMYTNHQVSVYGDVVVQGDAFISGADIYGDVYCYGDKLTMVDVNVYGNVYFAGSDFSALGLNVNSGTLNVTYNGQSATKNLSGGNVIIAGLKGDSNYKGYDAGAGFGTAQDVGGSASDYEWGATLTNCNVYGNLWSAVNTHIMCSKWDEGSKSLPDKYGNIYVEQYLFIDLTFPYTTETDGLKSGHHENWLAGENNDYNVAARWNCFERTNDNQVIYAERFQFRTNQVDILLVQRTDVNYLGTLCVGNGGFYVDGNDEWHNEETFNYSWNNSTKFIAAFTSTPESSAKLWDADFDNSIQYGVNEITLASRIADGYGTVESALSYKLTQLLTSFGQNTGTYGEAVFGNTQIWKDKVINLYSWTAPQHGIDEEDLETGKVVNYAGGEDGFGQADIAGNVMRDSVGAYLEFLRDNPAAGEVSGSKNQGNYTLTIKQSACFRTKADFTRFDRVIIDTTSGNVHIKFLGGAEFGDPAATDYDSGGDVILKGGNLTFWYLYQNGSYNIDAPTLKVNPFTQVGLVQAGTGGGYSIDGLYIISNDDCLIQFEKDASLTGFVYAPYSHFLLKPGSSGATNTLNGCMAIESLILIADGDGVDWFTNWWNNLIWKPDKIIDALVKQYENSFYDYVMPPLIMDAGFQYGDTAGELTDFNQVVWEFMGYY